MPSSSVSSVLSPGPSELALKGSSDDSPSMLLEGSKSDGGEEGNVGGGEKNLCGMPCSLSDVAECGEMMRTVLPVFVFVGRGRSKVH